MVESSHERKLRAIERWRSRREQKDEKKIWLRGRFKESERKENA